MFRVVGILGLDRIIRLGLPFSTHSFTDYFKGFEKVGAVRRIFGEKTDEMLDNLRVEFIPLVGYMGVNGSNGHLIVNPKYLNNGDRLEVYLDVVHELVHVRQFTEGRGLFDSDYSYVERPTEVEAYRFAVEEARRLGQSDEWICAYLKTPWMSTEDLKELAITLKVKCKG
ncbi:MAG TPA: hypothetical protein VJ574_06750 [Candidatus Bathyarchaeia archaeon]|nr:MAG: hypothetical protein A3K70_00095 [Candidatus Bathyarchaeota archaeon RBG_16_48_13]HJX24080.1 hypothetical protein [Candidatus Bathyarchaeia archaeon]